MMTPVEHEIRGYKVFKPDWTCQKKQYTCPGVFHEDEAVLCDRGMHFCTCVVDCFNYYPFRPDHHVCEVVGRGMIDYGEYKEDSKVCVTDLEIVRELTWAELLELVNRGSGNTGLSNIGSYNVGSDNIGSYNTGRGNVGNCNGGDSNVGSYNAGSWNVGNENTGNCNAGNYNAGSWNVGKFNLGMYNHGDFNAGCYTVGCFNTEIGEFRMFNKPSPWTKQDWLASSARSILMSMPRATMAWIRESNMSGEDKERHPEYETLGGYLLKIKCTNRDRQRWWDYELDDTQRRFVLDIPNFDAGIFKKCTGIDVRKEKEE